MKYALLFITLSAASACCGGGKNSSPDTQHLVCTDPNGNVVVDTWDLKDDPLQFDTHWKWYDKDGNEYEISAPPALCFYRQGEKKPGEPKPHPPAEDPNQ